ncbi:unnamed protein product [Rotaria magnacalcarata]|uniref:Uncharacterized protein n=1 Tax=Rotaria magnacalcarata TaxID=392030 RepID=A0A819XA34_9BILA|nr:unnamed protein product [Rotaria magnacalcarata]CAF2033522.1 unnamed protein product [Rotaria magnacalcarata]CAF4112916.1 unnamed protein product [Rotaria magnacalcarata]CAF4137620.1 unnamed protein product [Rotaria magnacalcarata]
MDYYSFERRHRRRRRHRSTSFHEIASDDSDDDIEQEIIDRAMEIERSREKSLRRQLEYIVHYVKKLERRRHERQRMRSVEHNVMSTSPSHRRNSDSHSHWDSSSERFYQTNDSSYAETRIRSRSKLRKMASYQITMNYRGIQSQRHGDEIMVLQENIIIFKGFLRPQETFTFKFKRHYRQLNVKLEFFINELCECCLTINCERKQINEQNEFFQLETIQSNESNEKFQTNDEEQLSSETEKSSPIDYCRRRRHHSNSLNAPTTNGRKRAQWHNGDYDRHKSKTQPHSLSLSISRDENNTSRENSYVKKISQNNPSPLQTLVTEQCQSAHEEITKNKQSKPSSTQASSKLASESSPRTISTNEKKATIRHIISSDNDDQNQTLQENVTKKASYGPPQLSTLGRSDSESISDELTNTLKQDDEKPSTDTIKRSESLSEKKDTNEDEENNDASGFLGFLQLLQSMSGGGIHVSSSNDDGDDIQSLLARLGIVRQTNSRKKSIHSTPRLIGNTENFLLVYLNSAIPEDSLVMEFRSLVNYLKIFDDVDDCIAFINNISNEKIIFIVSDALGDPVVSRIQDLQQLFAVYVLCQTEEQADSWSTNQPKIRGISVDINQILAQIKVDIQNDEESILPFTYILTAVNAKNESSFVKNQILKEILLDSDEMNEAKKELIEFGRVEYADNNEQLKCIEQFENEYRKENTIEFFRKENFLYKMLNRGFRIPEVDILFKLRLFIQNLHNFIILSSTNSTIKTVYRSQFLTNNELDTIKKCVDGGFIAFSNFFIASISYPEQKITSSSSLTDNQQDSYGEEIIFRIDISNSNHFMSYDNQILVTFGLVTRVENIEKDKNGKAIINLKTVNADDHQLESIIEPMRKETRAPHPSLRVVKLFMELEQYAEAIQLGQVLLVDSPNARKDPLLALARIYHSLGTTLYEKEEYDQALYVIKKSHDLYLRFLPDDAPQLSPTWNNMGSIYLRQGKTDLALEYHEKALSIQLKSPSPDLPSIISYSNNIGGVYLKLERYDEALVHFKRALQIEEQTLPKNHPELAGTYHRIGGVYFRQNNYEKALEFYDKTLEIELASLPDNHPTVAVTYHNRGTAFEGLGKLEEAIESAEKAVERLLKTLPKEHPQVRMNQAYVDRLKQKLWVKQLFTS